MSMRFYDFGSFRLDADRRILLRDGEPAPLSPKVFDTLVVLIRRPGQVMTKDELLAAVWPDAAVEENSLARNISLLRKTLGESASDHRYIVTIPGKGYSFVAAVREEAPGEPAPPDLAAASPVAAPRHRIRRLVLLGALPATLTAAAIFIAGLRPVHTGPFEATRTIKVTSSGQSIKAAISPDGRFIAHTSRTAGEESLFVRQTGSLHDLEIVPPGVCCYLGMTFSADGETVYYVNRKVRTAQGILYRIPAVGGSPQKLKEDLASGVTLSPDGKKYAFVRESATESTLIVADLETGAERNLISRRLPWVLDYPAWSPNGRVIACTTYDSSIASSRGSDVRILEVQVADRTERPISSQTWAFIRQISWLGDGRGLVVSARGEPPEHHLWWISYPGGTVRKVTDGVNSQIGVSISTATRQIVTVDENWFSSIWRIPSLQAPDPQAVVSGVTGSSAPVWTADGQILFEQNLDGYSSIWAVNPDRNRQRQLAQPGNNGFPSVGRQRGRVAFVSDRGGSPAIWTMDLDGGNPESVIKVIGGTVPNLSPDERWIVFTAPGADHWPTLWRVSPKGGPPLELNNRLWVSPVISPDGKWIAGIYTDRQPGAEKLPENLAVVSIDGGQLWKVFPIPPSVSLSAGIRWSPDGREVTFVIGGKDGDNIWSQSLEGGAPRQMTRFQGNVLFGFDWSADDRQLVFSRGVLTRDVVLIQDVQRK